MRKLKSMKMPCVSAKMGKMAFPNLRNKTNLFFSPLKDCSFKRNYTLEEDMEKTPLTEIFRQHENTSMLYFDFLSRMFADKTPVQICREDFRAQLPTDNLSAVSGLILDLSDSYVLLFGKEGFKIIRSNDVTSVIVETQELKKLKPYFEKKPPVPPGLSLENVEVMLNFFNGRKADIKVKRQDVSVREYTLTEMSMVEGLLHCKLVNGSSADGKTVDGMVVFAPEEITEITFYYI